MCVSAVWVIIPDCALPCKILCTRFHNYTGRRVDSRQCGERDRCERLLYRDIHGDSGTTSRRQDVIAVLAIDVTCGLLAYMWHYKQQTGSDIPAG